MHFGFGFIWYSLTKMSFPFFLLIASILHSYLCNVRDWVSDNFKCTGCLYIQFPVIMMFRAFFFCLKSDILLIFVWFILVWCHMHSIVYILNLHIAALTIKFMYVLKKSGPGKDPWGTPILFAHYCFMSLKCDLTHFMTRTQSSYLWRS